MTQARLRQVARLEKLIVPYLKRQQEQKSQTTEFMRNEAFVKLANLALLILHGDPKIDEPLTAAWQIMEIIFLLVLAAKSKLEEAANCLRARILVFLLLGPAFNCGP